MPCQRDELDHHAECSINDATGDTRRLLVTTRREVRFVPDVTSE